MNRPVPTLSIVSLFDSFVAERRYLQNVSPKTVEWYRCSFKAFEPHLVSVTTEGHLRGAVRNAVMYQGKTLRKIPD
jgi:hypothetical protein